MSSKSSPGEIDKDLEQERPRQQKRAAEDETNQREAMRMMELVESQEPTAFNIMNSLSSLQSESSQQIQRRIKSLLTLVPARKAFARNPELPQQTEHSQASWNDLMELSQSYQHATSDFHMSHSQHVLAESLPVAASFHPAELFGSSTPPVAASSASDCNERIQSSRLSFGSSQGHMHLFPASHALSMAPSHFHFPGSFSSIQREASIPSSPAQAPLTTFPVDCADIRIDAARVALDDYARAIQPVNSSAFDVAQAKSHYDNMLRNIPARNSSAAAVSPFADRVLFTGTRRLHVDLSQVRTKGEEIFPMTLHRLLLDLEKLKGGTDIAKFIIPHGNAFIVGDVERFESEIMPNYFPRMNRFASFQRQLNLYNFARVLGNGPDRGAYYHELFSRGSPNLACTIRRTKIKGLFTVPSEKRRKRKNQEEFPFFKPLPDMKDKDNL